MKTIFVMLIYFAGRLLGNNLFMDKIIKILTQKGIEFLKNQT